MSVLAQAEWVATSLFLSLIPFLPSASSSCCRHETGEREMMCHVLLTSIYPVLSCVLGAPTKQIFASLHIALGHSVTPMYPLLQACDPRRHATSKLVASSNNGCLSAYCDLGLKKIIWHWPWTDYTSGTLFLSRLKWKEGVPPSLAASASHAVPAASCAFVHVDSI